MALFSKKTKTEDKVVDDKKKEVKKTTAKKTEKKTEKPSMKDLYSEGTKRTTVSKKKTTTDSKKKSVGATVSHRILVKPLITEKATHLSTENKYVFIVDKGANKIEIAKAVEIIYGVKVTDVNLINVKGKRVTRGRIKGKRKDFKKAIVTLTKGETIKLYEGV